MIASCAIGMGVSWNIANVGAVAAPIADHYSIGLAAVGLFTAVLFAAELGSMTAVGPLVRLRGARFVGAAALALCVAGNLATLAVDGVAPALALRFVVGVGVGLGFVGGTTYVQQAGGGALAQGIYGGLSLGTGGLAVATIPSLEAAFGWQAPFVSAAAIGAIALALLPLGPDIRTAPGLDESNFMRLLGDRRLLRFAAVQSAAFGLGIVLSNWVVTLLTHRGDYSPEAAGLIGALILVVGVVGRPAGGVVAHMRPAWSETLVGTALLLGGAGTALLSLAPAPGLAVVGALAVGLGAGLPFGPIVAGLGRTFSSSPGTAFGAMNLYALVLIVIGSPLLGLSFTLPGEGLIGFLAAAAYWLLAAVVRPGDSLLDPAGQGDIAETGSPGPARS